jgi:hypothetical protein
VGCRYTKYKGENYWIPDCWGGVIHGRHACTCDVGRSKKDKIEELEKRIEKLEKILLEKRN